MISKAIALLLIKAASSCDQPEPVPTNCRPTPEFEAQPGMDTWCNVNCPVGNCPATHCICEDSTATTSGAPSTSTDAPSTSSDAPSTSSDAPSTSTDAPSTSTDAPSTSSQTTTQGSGGCRPTDTYASQPGMDTWCDLNCPDNCPATHCICDGAPTTDAPTTDAPTTDAPTTSNTPTDAPTTSNDIPTPDGDEIKGYYSWSWTGGDVGPANSNASCFFSGWSSVDSALGEFQSHNHPLQGEKYFSIGGGNSNGVLSVDTLNQFIQDISKVKDAGFEAVMFDVEKVRGSSSSVNPAFAQAFAAVKAAGMKVGITVSHTAPYDTDSAQDAADMVAAFVADTNVDVMSPQLYTSGWESSPDFAVTGSCNPLCGWDLYNNMHAGMKFAPSLANANQYDAVKTHFAGIGIETEGYFQWQQVGARALII